MNQPLSLIAGIGNPGDKYAQTHHNAGVWFVSRFAEQHGAVFREDKKFFGRVANVVIDGRDLRLLLPSTYMNESGKSVGALVNYYKIEPAQVLIVHDEIDLPTGTIKFKTGGGLAGHNGLRDIARSLAGSQDFNRLRIGVGHPGDKSVVINHVLNKVSKRDRQVIDECMDEALRYMPSAIRGDWEDAMNGLNGFRVAE